MRCCVPVTTDPGVPMVRRRLAEPWRIAATGIAKNLDRGYRTVAAFPDIIYLVVGDLVSTRHVPRTPRPL